MLQYRCISLPSSLSDTSTWYHWRFIALSLLLCWCKQVKNEAGTSKDFRPDALQVTSSHIGWGQSSGARMDPVKCRDTLIFGAHGDLGVHALCLSSWGWYRTLPKGLYTPMLVGGPKTAELLCIAYNSDDPSPITLTLFILTAAKGVGHIPPASMMASLVPLYVCGRNNLWLPCHLRPGNLISCVILNYQVHRNQRDLLLASRDERTF